MEVWNKWRDENPDIAPNLTAAKLSKAELFLANLSGADLIEAKLNGAKLKGVNLSGAKLNAANLMGAKLNAANLNGANLMGAKLNGAKLSGANLSKAVLFQANLSGANLFGASLKDATVTGIGYNKKTVCRTTNVDNCFGSPLFKRFVEDENYLAEYKSIHKWKYRFWWAFTDCGRSFTRVFIWASGLSLLFGAVYAECPIPAFLSDLPEWIKTFLVNINPELDMKGGENITGFTPYYFSIVTLTTLGFGDVTPGGLAGEIWVVIEVIAGYIVLGLLISIMANKIARRS